MLRKIADHFRGMGQRLLEQEGSPHALAGGVAVGIFFGFTPLFGLKTLLSLGVAMLLGFNPFTAVIAVCLHDILTPFVPVILRLEYDVGYWLMAHPHHLPPHLSAHHLQLHELLQWTTFFHVGLPMLLGSIVIGLPWALLSYFVFRFLIVRHRQRRAAKLSGD